MIVITTEKAKEYIDVLDTLVTKLDEVTPWVENFEGHSEIAAERERFIEQGDEYTASPGFLVKNDFTFASAEDLRNIAPYCVYIRPIEIEGRSTNKAKLLLVNKEQIRFKDLVEAVTGNRMLLNRLHSIKREVVEGLNNLTVDIEAVEKLEAVGVCVPPVLSTMVDNVESLLAEV